jgi:two-component system cell cycle sensor histidine kinase/response regulator CckA
MYAQQKILVVDDDAEAREMLCEFLSDQGYAVEAAPDGATALHKLDGFSPDLIVTDYEMPGMSGLELIRRVQMRDPGRPMLLVTAREELDLPRGAYSSSGPLVCLRKPLDLDALSAIVQRLIAATLHDGAWGARHAH